jgi:hypothetical protein
VVDAVPATALDEHDARVGQDAQMLHDREPAQFGQLAGQGTCRGRGVAEQVEQAAAPRAGQGAPQIRLCGIRLSHPR